MTTYNTGNPLGSTAAKDLYDNAQNLDLLMNGPDDDYPDRFGVARQSWRGMENDFNAFLISSGYEFIGDYDADGPLLISTANQIFTKDGEYWRAAASLTLPYTTINDWGVDEDNFVSVGDAALRQDLANPAIGASIVNNGGALNFKAFTTGISRDLGDRFEQVVNVAEFADLTVVGGLNTAFNLAQASLTRPGTIIIPSGFFTVNDMITVRSDIPVRITGAGMYSTVISANVGLTALPMFRQTGTTSDTFVMEDLTLLGNNFADLGYSCNEIIHAQFNNVMVQGTMVTGIRTNNGYNIDFNNCYIFSNSGGGIDCSDANNNNVTFNNCRIYANGGIGVQIANSLSAKFHGCGIETNAIAGVVAYDVRGLEISGNYFERNAATGLALTSPSAPESMTIKADIVLLNNGRLIQVPLTGKGCYGVNIHGNSFTAYGTGDIPSPGLSQQCIVFATSLVGLSMTSNDILEPSRVSGFLGTYQNSTRVEATSVRLEQNTSNAIMLVGSGNNAYAFPFAHLIHNSFFDMPFNYASQLRSTYAVLSGTTGALTDSTQKYGGTVAWEASVGDRVYGYTVDVTQNLELRGKFVWFGVSYRVQEANTGISIYNGSNTDNPGDALEQVTDSGVWKHKSTLKFVPADATALVIGFQRIGAGTQPLVIGAPTLSVVGNSFSAMNLRRV